MVKNEPANAGDMGSILDSIVESQMQLSAYTQKHTQCLLFWRAPLRLKIIHGFKSSEFPMVSFTALYSFCLFVVFFKSLLNLLIYYNTASVSCFGFLAARHAGS